METKLEISKETMIKIINGDETVMENLVKPLGSLPSKLAISNFLSEFEKAIGIVPKCYCEIDADGTKLFCDPHCANIELRKFVNKKFNYVGS